MERNPTPDGTNSGSTSPTTSETDSSKEEKVKIQIETEIKMKKKKKGPSICLTHCRYDIVRKVAQGFNLKDVGENSNWNLFWTDLSISIERCKEMKRFQRINHFPGMLEICRKDLLARNLNYMLKLFPKDYNFYPKTWCLPAELGDALNYSRLQKNSTFIIKPVAGNQGRGIFITKSLKDVKPTERLICQVYITQPFLIDRYKFDLRVYILITSCDPLRIYIYDEGLVRFATSKYHAPTESNSTNVFMHLTNYAVNKHSRKYNDDNESGSKRKLTWFNNYMRALGYDVKGLWHKIDDVIIKTIFAILPTLRRSYDACFPNHDVVPACCELLGIDILLDNHLSPQLLEVNHSPSFHTDTTLDTEVKNNLLSDMFAMLYIDHVDKRKIIKEDRKRMNEPKPPKDKEKDAKPNFKEYYRHEMAYKGGYRLIYPDSKVQQNYFKYLRRPSNALYSDGRNPRTLTPTTLRDKNSQAVKLADQAKSKCATPPMTSNFQPQEIVESEEKERLLDLAHRDFLVKSYGLVDTIHFLLAQNGLLRSSDKKKYSRVKPQSAGRKDKLKPHPHIQPFPEFCTNDSIIKMQFGPMKNSTLQPKKKTTGRFPRSEKPKKEEPKKEQKTSCGFEVNPLQRRIGINQLFMRSNVW